MSEINEEPQVPPRAGNNHPKTLRKVNTCFYCEAEFRKQTLLIEHIDSAHVEQRVCGVNGCGKFYMKYSALLNHIKTHREKVECGICGRGYLTRAGLDRHVAAHGVQFQCRICDQNCTSSIERSEHEEGHRGLRPHQCGVCGRQLRTQAMYEQHMVTHDLQKGRNQFPAPGQQQLSLLGNDVNGIPKPGVSSSATGDREEEMEEGGDDGQSGSENLMQNVSVEYGAMSPQFVCEPCGESFSSKEMLDGHLKGVHAVQTTTDGDSRCAQIQGVPGQQHDARILKTARCCGRIFRATKSLKSHEKFHMKVKLFHCPVCKRRIRSEEMFRVHMEIHGQLASSEPSGTCGGESSIKETQISSTEDIEMIDLTNDDDDDRMTEQTEGMQVNPAAPVGDDSGINETLSDADASIEAGGSGGASSTDYSVTHYSWPHENFIVSPVAPANSGIVMIYMDGLTASKLSEIFQTMDQRHQDVLSSTLTLIHNGHLEQEFGAVQGGI